MNTCIRCGYDLQQLPIGGPCPECGTPIEESLRGPMLANADPGWLDRIGLGQTILTWSLLVSALGAAVVAIGAPAAMLWGGQAGAGRAFEVLIENIVLGIGAGIVIALSAGAAGAVLLTTQEPKEREREAPLSARHLARWGMFAIVGVYLLGSAIGLLPLNPGAHKSVVVIEILLLATAVTVTVAAILQFLAGLAKRIPDERLFTKTNNSKRTLRWAIPVFAALALVPRFPGTRMATGMSFLDVLSMTAGCMSLVVVLLLIVHTVFVLIAMFAYRRAFLRCRGSAHDRR